MRLQHMNLKTLVSHSTSSAPLCSLSIFVSRFSTTSQTQPLHPHPFSRRHEEESRNVKVSVWWDFENCNLPADCNVFKISNTITAVLRGNGIMGPLQITAFGDIFQLSRANQEALSSTGVIFSHVPSGGKNSADRTLLVDLLNWISQNPPPAHLFLISGDRDFASVLHRLRMNNYNILLSAPGNRTSSVLCSAASIMWDWDSLLKGEELTGKHYNQPPDGPYGSWYGHYKVSLQDPFLVEQSEESSEGSDSKHRPVPEAITNQIHEILDSFPKGIPITDLRSELIRCQVNLDKDYYGYKKFSSFLLSMPQILWLQSRPDGQYVIHGITPKAGELSESSPGLTAGPVCRNGNGLGVSSISSSAALNGTSRLQHSPEVDVVVTQRKVQQTPPGDDNLVKVNGEESPREVQQTLPVDLKIAEGSYYHVTESHQAPLREQDSSSEVSFFTKVWQRWLGGSNSNSEAKNKDFTEKHENSEDSSAKRNDNTLKKCTRVSSDKDAMIEECEKKSCEASHHPVTVSSSSNVSTTDNKASSEAGENHSGKSSNLFNSIGSWCKFWCSRQESQSCGKNNQINTNSLKHEAFTQDSFWKDMEIILDSPEGSLLVTQSRTREEMTENLRKRRLLALRSLHSTDLLQLVDLLISDKKWIEECSSQTFPFKISRAVGKSPDLDLTNGFMRTPSDSEANLQQSKHEGDKKLQNIPHTGISSTVINEKHSERSRYEILADCRKLVKEIVKKQPEGYHIVGFRKLFLQRYGYPLHVKSLGYKKLASLLEIMPEVKIEESVMIRATTVPDNSGFKTAVSNIPENTSRARECSL